MQSSSPHASIYTAQETDSEHLKAALSSVRFLFHSFNPLHGYILFCLFEGLSRHLRYMNQGGLRLLSAAFLFFAVSYTT